MKLKTPSILSCQACYGRLLAGLNIPPAAVAARRYVRPSNAPKPIVDIKHIRQNPGLYEQNSVDRNFESTRKYSWQILELFKLWKDSLREARDLREQNNKLRGELAHAAHTTGDIASSGGKAKAVEQAKELKWRLSEFEKKEKACQNEMETLALDLPNLSSRHTPVGNQAELIGYINKHLEPPEASSDRVWRSHVHIGSELNILDFEGAAKASGWGWYYLKNEAALLEQALIQYAISKATKRGWKLVSPPSMVYQHIASACGFRPRDQHDEQQIYAIEQVEKDQSKPKMVMAGTAEIALAGMNADQTLEDSEMPIKVIGLNRCYRAEAGARGVDTKGLYRVHEFTKVELFAWTIPDEQSADLASGGFAPPSSKESQAELMFDEMLDLQKEMLRDLGLHCRILEMPTADLGASAARKVDIEAFFPSRRDTKADGWGELTSLSLCTDYQTRRLATRLKMEKASAKRLDFPWTLNGTALAVPRVLAAILENGWDEERMAVTIPKCLRGYMGDIEEIVADREKIVAEMSK